MAEKKKYFSAEILVARESLDTFPPKKVTVDNEGEEETYHVLGTSTSTDLIPKESEVISDILRKGSVGQFIATSSKGKIYDVCLSAEENTIFVRGIKEK